MFTQENIKRAIAEFPKFIPGSPRGTKVKPIYLDGAPFWGSESDRESVGKHLMENRAYTVWATVQHTFVHNVELEEFPGILFNSVCLSPVKEENNADPA